MAAPPELCRRAAPNVPQLVWLTSGFDTARPGFKYHVYNAEGPIQVKKELPTVLLQMPGKYTGPIKIMLRASGPLVNALHLLIRL